MKWNRVRWPRGDAETFENLATRKLLQSVALRDQEPADG